MTNFKHIATGDSCCGWCTVLCVTGGCWKQSIQS